ncbi:hypothetical protein CEXT_319491 [Caerostris extrusa]|uniref:Uncharacterized protein n=1 Tax=Caerostris extrusa TaxID=172846 RepID=A0AAV4WZT0_CAEEX|nr:hypothetical protein CEXT_319491 [Caerostris extrusa]
MEYHHLFGIVHAPPSIQRHKSHNLLPQYLVSDLSQAIGGRITIVRSQPSPTHLPCNPPSLKGRRDVWEEWKEKFHKPPPPSILSLNKIPSSCNARADEDVDREPPAVPASYAVSQCASEV